MRLNHFVHLLVVSLLLANIGQACTDCKEHQEQRTQATGSSAYMDDATSKRGFSTSKASAQTRKVYRMKADGSVQITEEAPTVNRRNDIDGIQVKF